MLEDDEKDYDYDAANDKDSIDDLDAELLFLSSKQELEHVQQTRYLAQRFQATSEINIFEENLNPTSSYFISDQKFKTKYRVSCRSLDKIVAKILDHPVFKSQTKPQAPVGRQLVALLHCMGHEGQTNESQKDVFRIGMGTCELYRDRVQKVTCMLL